MVGKHVFVAFLLGGVTGLPAGWAQQSPEQLPSGLREALIDATYAVERSEDEAWIAPNPAQRMRSAFTAEEGVRVEGDDGKGNPWGLTLALEAWGRSDELVPAQSADPVAMGRRVEYRRGPLIEWYVNDQSGLQQGFTLDERPAGNGSLELVLAIGGGFEGHVERGGRSALLTDRATGSVLQYSDLRAWDQTGRELEASLAIEGRRLLLHVEDALATYPVQIDPWIATEEAKLVASDAEADDSFGISVALSGDTAVIGAFRDDSGGTTAGSAYVFVRNGATWSEQQKLMASDASSNDQFGRAVAVLADTAMIGAPGDGPPFSAGSVYVFMRSGTTWTEQQKLVAGDKAAGDFFGNSVSLVADTAVIGAYLDDHGSAVNAGSAYVFMRSEATWTEQQKLVPSDPETSDSFGGSVALFAETAVVGAPGDNAAGIDQGAAYVFARSGTTWSQQQTLIAADGQDSDGFGGSVALWQDTAVIGAPTDDNSGGPDAGSAYVFVRTGSAWNQQQQLIASDAAQWEYFGNSVAVEDNLAVIGAVSQSVSGGPGSAYLFGSSGTTWTEEAKLIASDASVGDGVGSSVALSGDSAVLGAPAHDPEGIDAGAAYVFRLSPATVVYCTAGVSASSCQALLSASGTPSASAASGFSLMAATVEGQKDGLFFFGTSGKQANPWGNGTSYQCVVPPVSRAGTLAGSGTLGACDGSFAQDLNALWCPSCPKPAKNPGSGAVVQAQLWYRDPQSTSNQTTSLSDAIEFSLGP